MHIIWKTHATETVRQYMYSIFQYSTCIQYVHIRVLNVKKNQYLICGKICWSQFLVELTAQINHPCCGPQTVRRGWHWPDLWETWGQYQSSTMTWACKDICIKTSKVASDIPRPLLMNQVASVASVNLSEKCAKLSNSLSALAWGNLAATSLSEWHWAQ